MGFQSLKRLNVGVLLLLAAAIPLAAGCHRKDASDLHAIGPDGPDYYKDIATSIEYSTTEQDRPEVVTASIAPHTIAERQKDQIWDLTLGQAIQMSLANNKIIRSAGAFTTPGNGLMSNPNGQPSVYDSAIQETGVLLGARGVEAALSDFDATWTTTFNIGQNSDDSEQRRAGRRSARRPGARPIPGDVQLDFVKNVRQWRFAVVEQHV